MEADVNHALDEEGFSLDGPHPLGRCNHDKIHSSGKGISYEVLRIAKGVNSE